MSEPKKREYFDLKKFARDISRCREDKGYTQEEMAAYLGVQRHAILRYEEESNIPTPDNLFRICAILGLDPNDYRIKTSQDNEKDCNETEKENPLPVFDNEAFRHDLREARLNRNLRQDDLVPYDINRTVYGTIERTGKLSTEMLYKLSDILHITDLGKYIKRQ